MNERSSKNPSAPIEELPDRIAHRRKIAERIARIVPSMQLTTQREMSIVRAPGTACSDKPRSRGQGAAQKFSAVWPIQRVS
jgi:hypothetical protein